MYGYQCPDCGAWLDPGERCDCRDERIQKQLELEEQYRNLLTMEKDGQLKIAV